MAAQRPVLTSVPGVTDRERFQQDLEFVQCLASAEYLNWLAQARHFDDPAFLAYLQYLQYWQRPEYSHFITCAAPCPTSPLNCMAGAQGAS